MRRLLTLVHSLTLLVFTIILPIDLKSVVIHYFGVVLHFRFGSITCNAGAFVSVSPKVSLNISQVDVCFWILNQITLFLKVSCNTLPLQSLNRSSNFRKEAGRSL